MSKHLLQLLQLSWEWKTETNPPILNSAIISIECIMGLITVSAIASQFCVIDPAEVA